MGTVGIVGQWLGPWRQWGEWNRGGNSSGDSGDSATVVGPLVGTVGAVVEPVGTAVVRTVVLGTPVGDVMRTVVGTGSRLLAVSSLLVYKGI